VADPHFSSVSLLLHCDGSDGSTTFTDSSSYARTVTASGNAQIDTSQSKFGGASAQFDGGTVDCLTVPYAAELDLSGGGDWTVEGWARLNTGTGSARRILDFRGTGAWNDSWILSVQPEDRYIRAMDVSTSKIISTANNSIPASGTWFHWAAAMESGTLRLFVDGVLGASASFTTPPTHSGGILIGKDLEGDPGWLGHLDEIRITKGVARYTDTFTPPTAAFDDAPSEPAVEGLASDPGPLRQPSVLSALAWAVAADTGPLRSPSAVAALALDGHAAAPSPLGAPMVLAWHDFTGLLGDQITRYVMDLITPGGPPVRVPISSWQSTLQTDAMSYAQCVIPACTNWVTDIAAATEFVVSRLGTTVGGSVIEYEMARAPTQSISLDRGSFNYTATISGYTAAVANVDDPSASLDRTMSGVRTISNSGSLTRARCDVDWLLRPGQRAWVDGVPIVVRYINFYVTDNDQYMDIGDRA
jgi:hypothetical protein